ncbi:4'-phosphopantetheinyl transferase superfamily [Mycena sp. CBHHK59/15]|nr:4'-phosphopantetheinyl transferase superfamily [Mycena sp. CBHHK59/15]
MSVLGIGVDVVHVPRIAALLSRRNPQRFASRILSPQEAAQTHLLADPTFLAVRWAVKEAAYKALYPKFRPSWKDLTYHGLRNGHKPVLLYHPSPNNNLGDMHVSVSHDGEYVFASVLVQASRPRADEW